MTGGGFGGCAIAIATPQAADRLVREIPAAYRQRHAIAQDHEARVFTTSAQSGAAVLA
jgi:galactokinase